MASLGSSAFATSTPTEDIVKVQTFDASSYETEFEVRRPVEFIDTSQSVSSSTGLATHIAAFGCQQECQPLANDGMVIYHQNADGLRAGRGTESIVGLLSCVGFPPVIRPAVAGKQKVRSDSADVKATGQ